VSDDFTIPPVTSAESVIADVADTIMSAARQVNQAIESGRRPGMPLDVLAAKTRRAPLAALSIAFLLGMVVARRR
jgi:hypothetical protein